jgi:WD40 repeat protein
VLISGAGATIKMWDVKTGEKLASIAAGHGLFSFALSPDGRTLGTAGDESIKLWDVGGAGD